MTAANPAALEVLRSRKDFIDPHTYRLLLKAIRELEAKNERIAGEFLIERGLREATFKCAEKAQARVAELEIETGFLWARIPGNRLDEYKADLPIVIREAREREAD